VAALRDRGAPCSCRRGGGQLPVQRISLWLTRHCGRLHPGPPRLAVLQQQLQQQRFRTGSLGSHPSSPPTSSHPRFQLRFNCGGARAFRGQLFADPTPRRIPSGQSPAPPWQGAYLPYLRRLLAAATRQLPANSTRSSQVLESAIRRPAAAGQQCRHRPGRPWPPTGTALAEDWGIAPVATGSIQASRQLASDDERQAHVAGGPQPCWRWPMA